MSGSALSWDKLLTLGRNAFAVLRPCDSVILYASPTVVSVFGLSQAEMQGRTLLDFTSTRADREMLAAMLRAASASRASSAAAGAVVTSPVSGAFIHRSPTAARLVDISLSSDCEYIYAVMREAGSEFEKEERLEAFILAMSHDLRTPVHSLQCASGLLAERRAVVEDSDAMMLLRAIRSACVLLQTVNSNILDLRRLNALALAGSSLQLSAREPVDFRAVYNDCIQIAKDVYDHIKAPGHACDWSACCNVPNGLLGDEAAVRRLLQNAAVAACRLVDGATMSVEIASLARCPPGRAGEVVIETTYFLPHRRLSEADQASLFDPHTCIVGTSICVARALARAMDGDVTIAITDEGMRISAQLTLYKSDDPSEGDAGASDSGSRRRRISVSEQQSLTITPSVDLPPPPPPAPAVELTTRMFDHLVRVSDDMYHQGSVNHDGKLIYTYVSEAAPRHFHLPRESLLGHSPAETTHPDDLPRFAAALKDAMARQSATGNPDTAVELSAPRRLLRSDGSSVPVLTSCAIDSHHWYKVCHDLTSQGNRHAALRALLLSTSCELREPANAILSAAHMLQSQPSVTADEEAAFLVHAIASSCSVLVGLISNVSSLNSIETGGMDMTSEAFDPVTELADIVDACRFGCDVDITAIADEPMPRSVIADRGFFVHILQNLLSNALRYEAGGGVRVGLRFISISGGSGVLEGSVTDWGSGMEAAEAARVFDLYTAGPTAKGGGSGVGLYIARICARRAGGDLSVRTSPGVGSTFTFSMLVTKAADYDEGGAMEKPAAKRKEAMPSTPKLALARNPPESQGGAKAAKGESAALPESSTAAASLRIMLADDNDLNLRLVRRMLEGKGLSVSTARDGTEAFEKLVALYAAGTPPHAAMLDVHMPKRSGVECARDFRIWETHNSPERHLPLIAFTANVCEGSRKACEAAGMEGYIMKPIDKSALATIVGYAETTAAADAAAQQ